MAKKCFLSRSAEERVKLQAKQMKKMDKFVNKKVKNFKSWWKKKIAKKLAWGVLAAVAFSWQKLFWKSRNTLVTAADFADKIPVRCA